jgi:hypothetical protein
LTSPPRHPASVVRVVWFPRACLIAQRPERLRDAAPGGATRKNERHDSGEDRTILSAIGSCVPPESFGGLDTTVDPNSECETGRGARAPAWWPYHPKSGRRWWPNHRPPDERLPQPPGVGRHARVTEPDRRGTDRLRCTHRLAYL